MKKIIANYHSHLKYCNHASGYAYQYIEESIKNGFEEVGISDHAPLPREWFSDDVYNNFSFKNFMTYETYKNVYLKELNECIKEYSNKIKIYKGLEIEYFPNHDDYYLGLLSEVDYLALGIHCFCYNGKYYSSYRNLNSSNILGYADVASRALDSGMFKIFVHPELFMYNYNSDEGLYEFDSIALKASKIIVEACLRNDVYLEINCNRFSSYVKLKNGMKIHPYPRKEFWEVVNEYQGAKIIIGSDAHRIEDVNGENVKKGIEFANMLGLNVSPKIDFRR